MTLDHDSSRRAKKARPLVVGERCHVLGPGNKWIEAFVTGITDSGRSYETQVEATGKQLTRNRSHIRPRSPDIPHMHASFLQRNVVLSATSDGNAPSKRQNSVISGNQQLADGQKTVLSGNRKGSIKQTNTSQINSKGHLQCQQDPNKGYGNIKQLRLRFRFYFEICIKYSQ